MVRRSPKTAKAKARDGTDRDGPDSARTSDAAASSSEKPQAPPVATTKPLASWDDFTEECASWCTQEDRTAVHQLIHARLVPFLETRNKDEFVRDVLQQPGVLQTLESLRMTIQTTQRVCDNSALIHQIQLQVAVRLALWSWAGVVFVQEYAKSAVGQSTKQGKKSRKHKKRKQQSSLQRNPTDSLLQDLIGFLQLGALRLGPDTPFLHFVKQCVCKEQSESLPQLEQIWDTFEVANPFLHNDDVNEDAATAADRILALSPPPKRKLKRKEPPAAKPPPNDENQSTVTKNNVLPVTNVSLTAPIARKKPNSLLLGSNTRFVGSHFNTRLSNVGSLFRQVVVEKKRDAAKPCSKQSLKSKGSLTSRRPLKDGNAASASQKVVPVVPCALLQRAPQISVPDTPLAAAASSFQTPSKRRRVTLDTTSVVLETPHGILLPTTTNRVRKQGVQQQQQMLPPPPKRAGMTLVVTKQPQVENSMPQQPPRASSLVAEAFSSLRRRQDRRRNSM